MGEAGRAPSHFFISVGFSWKITIYPKKKVIFAMYIYLFSLWKDVFCLSIMKIFVPLQSWKISRSPPSVDKVAAGMLPHPCYEVRVRTFRFRVCVGGGHKTLFSAPVFIAIFHIPCWRHLLYCRVSSVYLALCGPRCAHCLSTQRSAETSLNSNWRRRGRDTKSKRRWPYWAYVVGVLSSVSCFWSKLCRSLGIRS